MNSYIVSPDAEDDIFEIWRYLTQEAGPGFANRVETELFNDFSLLAHSPGLGHKRQDLTRAPVLFFRAFPHPYMIVYRTNSPLEIVAVLHAKRNIKALLQSR